MIELVSRMCLRRKVIPLLAEYFYEDWSKVAAVLGDSGRPGNGRFLEATTLQQPKDLLEDEPDGQKIRWNVRKEFDWSEFEA